MKRATVLLVFVFAGCNRMPSWSVDALAAHPPQLHALHAQCHRGMHDRALCAQVERAELKRFLSGRSGPEEYRTLAELPSIPPSFDGPVDALEPRP